MAPPRRQGVLPSMRAIHGLPRERPMKNANCECEPQASPAAAPAQTSQSIEWYAEGQERTVDVGGVRVTVRFIGRKGRRGRIAIEAPAGAVFRALDLRGTVRSPDGSA